MTRVDPYVVRFPNKWTDTQGNLTFEARAWLDYDNKWKQQIWDRTGGGSDDVEGSIQEGIANNNQIAGLLGLIDALQERVASLESNIEPVFLGKEFRAVTITQNYTAIDHDLCNVKLGKTVKLESEPVENAIIKVRNGDGSRIKIDGNGKTINGLNFFESSVCGSLYEIQYFIDTDEWVIT